MRNLRTSSKDWNLAGGQYNEVVLKTLFLEHLPDNLRSILAICEGTELTKLAQLADKVFEMSKPNVAQVDIAAKAAPIENATTSCGCTASMNELTKQVRELWEIQRDRSRRKRRSEDTRRSRSRSRESARASKLCYYHRTFGEKAYKYILPCEWKRPLAKNPNMEN